MPAPNQIPSRHAPVARGRLAPQPLKPPFGAPGSIRAAWRIFFALALGLFVAGIARADRPGVVYPFRAPDIDTGAPIDTAAGGARDFRPGRALVAGRLLHYEWSPAAETFVRSPVTRVVAAVIDRSGAARRRMVAVPDSDGLFVLPQSIASRGETITVSEWESDRRVVRRTATDRLFAAVSGQFPPNLYGFVWLGDISFHARETDAVFQVARPLPGLLWSWRLDSRHVHPAYRHQSVPARAVVPYGELVTQTDSRWAEVLRHISGQDLEPNARSRYLSADQVRGYRQIRNQEQAADSGIVRSLRHTLRVLATLGERDNHRATDALAKSAEFIAQTFSIFHAIFQADGPPGRRSPTPPSRTSPGR